MVSGCINDSMKNTNDLLLDVNNSIVNGDKYYNEAVDALNSKDYGNAINKANLAIGDFTDSLNKINKTNDYKNEITNNVYINYLDTVANELKYKKEATDNLILSINSFKEGNIAEGNDYGYKANSAMDKAIVYQENREKIVNNNPDLFK